MRYVLMLLPALLLVAGCGLVAERESAEAGEGKDVRSGTIAVGQGWGDAQATATRAGYALHDVAGLARAEVHDAAGLARAGGIDGFYLRLADDRDLIVIRQGDGDAVGSLELVTHASKAKSQRVHESLQSFALPAAGDP
jgi:uncharacterized protein YceK